MKTKSPKPPQNAGPDPPIPAAEEAVSELAPITRIGIETELSKYPVHNLAKKGRVDIQIVRKTPTGQTDLKWEVSYSERYGQPRQLAYKIDTVVINRRIDEQRPLPKFIRLGSLRDIADQLDLGGDTNLVRKALRQNAFVGISAKLKYRAVDGTEKQVEADFTRYSVVFTGEKLPNGKEADAVYIVLNDIFKDVLDNAPIRPLNYAYLKILKPAAQRFYEIISPRIYAAIKSKTLVAKIPYSEFCTYSALTRHLDYENFRVQMAKIHRPHLKSGYLAKVHYDAIAVDGPDSAAGGGKPDWMMHYVPGPQAKAEFHEFNRKGKIQILEAFSGPAAESVELAAPRRRRSRRAAEPELERQRPVDPKLLAELTRRGIAESDGRDLLAMLPADQPVLDQIEWGDFQIEQHPDKFTNPPGFYISLLQRSVTPPATFESTRARATRLAASQAQQRRILEAQAAAAEAEQAEYEKAEARLAALSPEKYQALFARFQAELISQNPFIARQQDAGKIHEGAIRARMIRFLSE